MSIWKKLGIVLLCLLLLGSLGFLLFKDRILAPNDEGGVQQEIEPLGEGELEIIIEEPRKPETKAMRALELDASVLRGGTENALKKMGELGANALSIRVKSSDGKLHYSSTIPEAAVAEAVVGNTVSNGAIDDLLASGHHSIARVAALHDSTFAYRYSTDAAILQLQYPGVVWYDPDSTFWLDPEKDLTRGYLAGVVAECAALGFDEVLLDEFAYPSNGRQSNIDESGRTMTKGEALEGLAQELFETLQDSETLLSVELDAQTILDGGDETKGQNVASLAPYFDRIYVKTTAEQLPQLAEALSGTDVELIPILSEALPDMACMIGQ